MNTPSRVLVTQKFGAVVDPLQVLRTMVDVTQLWVSESQAARIQRAEIAAWEATQLSRIRAQKEVLLAALDLTFDERRNNFRRLFDGLDVALANRDTGQAVATLEAITALARESPFKELENLEIVVNDLKRPDKVWDV